MTTIMLILEVLRFLADETPPPAESPVGTVLVAALSAGGIGAILAAVVTGIFSKRKLGAEATKIITDAAAGVVTNLQQELNRQVELRIAQAEEHSETMKKLVAGHVEEMEEVRRVLQLHVAWDAIAIAKMSEVGVELPPAPPLLPPHKRLHLEGFDNA